MPPTHACGVRVDSCRLLPLKTQRSWLHSNAGCDSTGAIEEVTHVCRRVLWPERPCASLRRLFLVCGLGLSGRLSSSKRGRRSLTVVSEAAPTLFVDAVRSRRIRGQQGPNSATMHSIHPRRARQDRGTGCSF